ncbi:MAG TPA: aspartyl protease family protein [Chthonomonadaceae bacterium]|nr:aspartyl protease family protein [Chthonomonadaceae bacterium]
MCTVSALLALAAGRPASGQRAYTVGTDTDAHGTMYVPVRLNQRMPATFFFDTGSSTFVSDAFVAKHALPTQPLGPKNGYPFKLPDGSPVLVTHLDIQIGETPILISQDVPVLKSAVIRSMGVECDGILGVDSVNGMAVHVNLAARQIAFIPGGNLSASMRKRLGIDTVKPAPLIPAEGGRYQVPATVGELPTTLMLVDTGSEFTRIPAASANKIGSAWRPSGVIDTAEGRFPVYSTYAAKLTVAGASVPRQRVLYSDRSAGPSPGPLGRDFFSRFAVTIDYPAGRLYLRDLDVAAGPSPFARRLRGDEALFPTYTVAFPYGGKTVRNGESRRYDPGASAAFPGAEGPDGVKVSRNGPSDGLLSAPTELPITFEGGAAVVQASIGGRSVRLAIDTGSLATWLTPAAVDRLDLKQITVERGGVTLRRVTLDGITLSSAMPEYTTALCEAFVGDAASLYSASGLRAGRADGVLGADCLAGFVLGFDLDRSRVLLWPMASTEADRSRWLVGDGENVKPPITIPLDHQYGDWYFLNARTGDGQTAKLALATGFGGVIRQPESFAALSQADATGRSASEQGADGRLRIDGWALEPASLDIAPDRGALCIPVLGLAALRGRRVVLDLAARKILIGRSDRALADRHGD